MNRWTIEVGYQDYSKQNLVLFQNKDVDNYGFVGWNPSVTYPLTINANVFDDDGIHGSQNDKLLELFYTYPSELVKK